MSDALTDFIIKPSAPFAAGVILFGVVWGFFKGVESVLSDDTKLEIAVWLLGVKTAGKVRGWPDTFAKVFDRVFGKKHLSWQCFFRSVISTTAVLVITSGAFYWFSPYDLYFDGLRSVVSERGLPFARLFGVFYVCAYCIPDYLSLLKTRWLIHRLRSRSWMPLILLVDAVVGLWIGYEAIELGSSTLEVMVYKGGVNESLAWQDYGEFLLRTLQHPFGFGSAGTSFQFAIGIPVLYAPLFTSIWLWLYAGSGFLLKAARRFDIGFQWFNRRFDIEKKPLQSIGLVAGALVALVYWGAVIVSRVV